jgi:hypothetical protein
MYYVLEDLELTVWDTIHVLCTVYNRIVVDDIKYLKCLITSIFYLLPENYTRYALTFLYTNDITKVPSSPNNEHLINWSINFRNFMNRRFNRDEITIDYVVTKFDFKNIYKNVWGNLIWKLMHYLAVISDINSKYIKFKSFISCLQYTIPCTICRRHFKQHLIDFPLDDYKNNVFEWSVIVHNDTNAITVGSPYSGVTFSMESAYAKYYNVKALKQ